MHLPVGEELDQIGLRRGGGEDCVNNTKSGPTTVDIIVDHLHLFSSVEVALETSLIGEVVSGGGGSLLCDGKLTPFCCEGSLY